MIALAEKQYAPAAQELKLANQQDPRILYLTAVALQGAGDAQGAAKIRRQGREVQRPELQLRLREEQGAEAGGNLANAQIPNPKSQ